MGTIKETFSYLRKCPHCRSDKIGVFGLGMMVGSIFVVVVACVLMALSA